MFKGGQRGCPQVESNQIWVDVAEKHKIRSNREACDGFAGIQYLSPG